MNAIQLYTLENAHWQVGILPATGGSIAFARLRHGERWADLLRPTPESSYGNAADCASFIMLPWASRIDKGQFVFRGTHYSLKINEKNTAIHGIGRDYPWHIDSFDKTHIVLHFNSADYIDANFPFRFSAQVEYTIQEHEFIIKTILKNEDNVAMPGGFGHHPYFQRSLTDQAAHVELKIPCTHYMDLSTGVPTKPPEPVPERLNFMQLRTLGDDDVDDCLTGRIDSKPIHIVYPASGRKIAFYADDVFKIIVLYAPPGKDYFAVEPLTLATDGFNLYEKNIPGSGVFVLEPGKEKSGTMALVIR